MHITNYNIRDAEHGDLDSLEVLWRELYTSHQREGMLLTLRPDASKIWRADAEAKLGSAHSLLLVAALNSGEIAGFITGKMKLLPPIHVERRCGSLGELYVAPAMRTAQIGRSLVNAALARIASWGASSVELQVIPGNAAGIAFWNKLGWKTELFQLRWMLDNPGAPNG